MDCDQVLEAEDVCGFAREHCEDFTAFYFCGVHGGLWAWPLLASLLALMLYLLGSTANEYFSPALAEVSKRLRLSPTLAISALSFALFP